MKAFLRLMSIGSIFFFLAGIRAGETPSAPQGSQIQAVSKGVWYGKPPLAVHFFDVSLHNPSKDPRWFLIPETFPYKDSTTPKPGDGNLAELEVFLLSKKPKLVLARGTGSHFWAVKLPGDGSVKLRMLPIESWWEHHPAAVQFEVIVAKSINLAGKPFEECFKSDPLSDKTTDAKAPRNSADERIVQAWHPPEGVSEVSLNIDVEKRDQISVTLVESLQ